MEAEVSIRLKDSNESPWKTNADERLLPINVVRLWVDGGGQWT